MSNYILKSRKDNLTSYASFVAEGVADIVLGIITWDLTITDIPEDATKFCFISDIFTVMEAVGLSEDDWEVVSVQG